LQADSLICDTTLICPDTLVIDESPTTDTLYQAAELVTTEGVVEISNGLNVTIQAGKEVSLKPGFYAAINADCTIKIQECVETFAEDPPESLAAEWVEETVEGENREDSVQDKEVSRKGNSNFVAAVYPNPAQDEVTIIFDSLEEDIQLIVIDLRGKALQFRKVDPFTEKVRLDVSLLPSGIYFLHFQGENGRKVVHKLAKVRY
jgi:hypothetical protein